MDLRGQLRPALVMLSLLTVLTGLVYPLGFTALAQLFFSAPANGSLIIEQGRPVGSNLIGQPFDDPGYFWGRLSATTPAPYTASASSGSNFGPLSDGLRDAVKARVDALRAADPGNDAPIPVDLVTSSASGLDPHITPAAARYQASRVARVRGMPPAEVGALVDRHTEGRKFGILGEPRVNVLALNRALDARRRR
jgi:potassium-transporting ATPase KdpC subunit